MGVISFGSCGTVEVVRVVVCGYVSEIVGEDTCLNQWIGCLGSGGRGYGRHPGGGHMRRMCLGSLRGGGG